MNFNNLFKGVFENEFFKVDDSLEGGGGSFPTLILYEGLAK